MKTLEQRVDEFVEWSFSGFQTTIPRGPKVVNDALLGNQYFSRHEIAILDSPLLQRLKRIKQTGLVYQVYPSARHTRFEHSLGVATLAERCFHAIYDRSVLEGERFDVGQERHRGDLAELRLAALLHDTGHGLCSHAAEQIYEADTDLREFKANATYAKNSPGEILSHLIVKSKAFRDWYSPVLEECGAKIDLDKVADMILGRHEDQEKYFLAQIISSPYDADKLDYIARDSLYCGLALTVDLPRFYNMISTAKYDDHRILVLRNYVPLEQILFSKMTLFGSVYHHQKVKCLDHMLRAVVQHVHQNGDSCAIDVRGKRVSFAEPVEYLYVTDDDFFGPEGFGDDLVRSFLRRFRERNLLRRCVEISRQTVERESWAAYSRKKLIDLSADYGRLRAVEDEIYRRVPAAFQSQCSSSEVLLSVPPPPRIKTDYAFVQTGPGGEVEPIEHFFPVEQWTESYSYNKWKSFVFAPVQIGTAVRDAAISALRDSLGLEINVDQSNRACHL